MSFMQTKKIHNTMKKLLALTFALFAVAFSAKADDERPITVQQLPAAAQAFIKQHFADRQVALAKEELEFMSKSYEVVFTDLTKIEFAGNGQWTDMENDMGNLPASAIPEAINQYVNTNYPNNKIKSIERKYGGYEVDLLGGLDLKFNNNFVLIGIDLD